MKFLQNKLQKVIAKSKHKKILEEKLSARDFEFVFITLLHEKLITYNGYLDLKSEHTKRNLNLEVIKITAPRTFGKWGEDHMAGLIQELKPASEIKASGEFDL